MQAPAVVADTARAFLNVTFPKEALPWPVIVVFMVCVSLLVGMVIQKAKWYKSFAADFPTQTSVVIAGIGGFAITLALVLTRGALGMGAFDGMDWAFGASCSMAGVGGGMLLGKRFSSQEYQQGKANIEAAKAAATSPPVQMNVAGDAPVQNAPQPVVTAEHPAVPQGGVKPKDPAVLAGIEAMAAAQRGKIIPPSEPSD